MHAEGIETSVVGSQRLALNGGAPVRTHPLPYGSQEIREEDIEAVVRVLRSNRLTTGPMVAAFEEAVAARVGSRYAVSFSSGTAALHAAVFAAGIGQGDEAITAPITFCATANCVVYQGGRPVFADVEPDTLTINPVEVKRRISPRVKVVLPIDYAGHPADLEAILALADTQGWIVIEDACHALGAARGGRRIGSVSHLTVFSFHPVKHITTGEGGMVTTNSLALAKQLRLFRHHGIDSDSTQREASGQWQYNMVALGYNYRLTDIGCALGLSQLKRLDENLERRRVIAARYTDALQQIPGVRVPTVRAGVTPAWHLYPIQLRLERLRGGRDEMFRALRAEGIGVNVHYIPLHLHPYYAQRFGYSAGAYPVSEAAAERLISLPMFHAMTDQDVEDVLVAVRKVMDAYAR